MRTQDVLSAFSCLAFLVACGSEGAGDADGEASFALESHVSCTHETEPGYENGVAIGDLDIVRVDGFALTKNLAHAFLDLQKRAAERGFDVAIESGFRTMREQERLWRCFQNRSCNGGNVAARPGFSNHQSGTAIDFKSQNLSKLSRLIADQRLPWKRTVPGEPWHYEYAGDAVAGPCD